MTKVGVAFVAFVGAFCLSTFAEDPQKTARPFFRITPRSPAEKFFLIEEDKSPIDPTNPNIGLGRVAFPNGHFTYRIPLGDVRKCTLNMEIGNRYKISASTDNATWKILANVKDVSGLSNYGTYPFDLSPFLPAERVYLKFEDSQNAGWGCWLRSVTVLADRPTVRPVLRLDAVGRQPLNLDLGSVLVRGDRVVSPRNPTSVELSLNGHVLEAKIVCHHSEGYTPVSVATTRDGEVFRDDCVELFVGRADQPADYRHFGVNSANVQLDELGYDISRNWEWTSSAKTGKTAWKAELAIDLQKTGLDVSPGQKLLLCVSRFDGDSGQVAILSPFANWGLHQPESWTKVVLSDRSSILPSLEYDVQKEVIRSRGTSAEEKVLFMVMDRHNNTVYSDSINPGETYSAPLKFEKSGSYRIYSYSESGLASLSSFSIEEDVVDRFTAEAIAPIFYVGEKVKIAFSVPERARGSRVSVHLFSGGEEIQANIENTDGQIVISDLEPGEYRAELRVEKDEGSTVSIPFAMRKSTSVPAKVRITPAGFVKIDGKFVVPIMVHIPQDLTDIKAKGFNMVVAGSDNPADPKWIEDNVKLLDEAHVRGLKVLLHLCNLLRADNEHYESLKLAVASLKNHPGLFGWFTADEPSGNVFDIGKLEKAYKIVKAIDQNHPVVVLDNVPMMLKTYAPFCDILSSDPYPVPSSPLKLVRDWTDTTLRASQTRCIYMVLQGQGPPYYSRQPSFEEQKIMLRHALEGGAKSIGWWAHGTLVASGYWDRFGELTAMAREYIAKSAK